MEEYVPLFQTLVWPVFLAILIVVFRSHFSRLIEAFRRRIEEGSSFKAGPIEIGENLRSLDYRPPANEQQQTAVLDSSGEQEGPRDWEPERTGIYQRNRGIFLAHVLTPARRADEYDIFIYLIRHPSNDNHEPRDLSDVEYAEFFLGHMWGNRVFREAPKHDGMIGMSTYAYGPFLCICRVHLTDGSVVKLDRYIDFEMGKMLYEASK